MPVNVSWFFAPIPVDLSDDKTTISDASGLLMAIDFSDEAWEDALFSSEEGTPNDTLRFESIGVAQNGLFACNVSNSLGSDSTFLLVGVKGEVFLHTSNIDLLVVLFVAFVTPHLHEGNSTFPLDR